MLTKATFYFGGVALNLTIKNRWNNKPGERVEIYDL